MGVMPAESAPSADALLSRKLAAFGPLGEEDLAMVRELTATPRPMPRRVDVLTEGRNYRAVHFVIEGILMRYRILRDGRRQVLSLVLPGDFVGIPGCLFDGALYSVKALTDIKVATIPIARPVGPVRNASAAGRGAVVVVFVRGGALCRASDPGRPLHRGRTGGALPPRAADPAAGGRARGRVVVLHSAEPRDHRRRAGPKPALREPGPAPTGGRRSRHDQGATRSSSATSRHCRRWRISSAGT